MLNAQKQKVLDSDIAMNMRTDDLKSLVEKLSSNYEVLFSMIEKAGIKDIHAEILATTFRENIEKVYKLIEQD